MRYEHILLSIMLFVIIQNILIRRKYQQLWRAMDKTKYIQSYRHIIKNTPKQAEALKILRKQFPELSVFQAFEVSQLSEKSSS